MKKKKKLASAMLFALAVSGLLQAIEMLDKMRGELLRQAQAGPTVAPESTH